MLMSTAQWRERITAYLPEDAIPESPELGVRYPWRSVALHSMSYGHRKRVERAEEVLHGAPEVEGLGWYLAISGGKDSVAVAVMLHELGAGMPAMCALRTSVDYPGKDQYVRRLCEELGHRPHLLYPQRPDDALAELVAGGLSLADDPGAIGRAMVESGLWGNVGDWLSEHDYAGVILGLRAQESRGRRMNRKLRGHTYERRDGMTICCPIADWSTMDVHAYLAARDVPLLPLYLCVDPGDDGMRLREDSFLCGGWTANLGGYTWLRRWWPEQWGRIVDADPTVRELS